MSIYYKNYYSILEIDHSADFESIQKSFRNLARKYHPDLNPNQEAEQRFKEISEAYEVLSDPEKKRQYDQVNSGAFLKPDFDTFTLDKTRDFSSFFKTLFGTSKSFLARAQRIFSTPEPINGQDLEVNIVLNKAEALKGITREYTFEFIDTDASGNQIRSTKKYRVRIPANTKMNDLISLAEQGAPGINGGCSGNLLLRVIIE